jgi:hypothetical protein
MTTPTPEQHAEALTLVGELEAAIGEADAAAEAARVAFLDPSRRRRQQSSRRGGGDRTRYVATSASSTAPNG